MVFIIESTLLIFPFTLVVHPVYMCWYTVLILFWSITLMVKCYDDYVSSSSLFSDCSQLIKRGNFLLKAPTLIHPPSQCDRCVQHPLSKTKFEYFRDKLGVVENAPLAEREINF